MMKKEEEGMAELEDNCTSATQLEPMSHHLPARMQMSDNEYSAPAECFRAGGRTPLVRTPMPTGDETGGRRIIEQGRINNEAQAKFISWQRIITNVTVTG